MHGSFGKPTIGRVERRRLSRARQPRRSWSHQQGARGARGFAVDVAPGL